MKDWTRAAKPPETDRSGTLALVKISLLSVLCLFFALPALGQDEPGTVVRVEVIVFQHTDGRPDDWPAGPGNGFNALPDPRERARLASWTARLAPLDAPSATVTADAALRDRLDDQADPATLDQRRQMRPAVAFVQASGERLQGPIWPDFYVALPSFSQTIQQAVRRLQDSPRHRVLTSIAWLQPLNRQTGSSPVRIRGNEALTIDWTQTTPTAIYTDPSIEPPDALPVIDYRLDGSLHLRQRQFRHVDLELVWSEAVPRIDRAPSIGHERVVHRLNLSRPVKMDRLEYFDSPWLGVLVLIQEWERPESGSAEQMNEAR